MTSIKSLTVKRKCIKDKIIEWRWSIVNRIIKIENREKKILYESFSDLETEKKFKKILKELTNEQKRENRNQKEAGENTRVK